MNNPRLPRHPLVVAVAPIVEALGATMVPADEREAGLSVRIDDEDIDRWWRCSIDRPIGDGAMSGTTITLATSESGTSFEIRCTVTPGGRRVSPRPPTVSVTSLRVLARSIVAKCAVYDAGMKFR